MVRFEGFIAGLIRRKLYMSTGYSGALWRCSSRVNPQLYLIPLKFGIVDQLNIAAGQVNCSGRVLFQRRH